MNNLFQCSSMWLISTLVGLLFLSSCSDSSHKKSMTAQLGQVPNTEHIQAVGSKMGYQLFKQQNYAGQVAPALGQFQSWVIELRDAQGAPLYPATINIAGGMPGHGHGLPSQPRVTEYLGEGRYRVDGLKFTMAGSWQLVFVVDARAGRDRIELNFEVEH